MLEIRKLSAYFVIFSMFLEIVFKFNIKAGSKVFGEKAKCAVNSKEVSYG